MSCSVSLPARWQPYFRHASVLASPLATMHCTLEHKWLPVSWQPCRVHVSPCGCQSSGYHTLCMWRRVSRRREKTNRFPDAQAAAGDVQMFSTCLVKNPGASPANTDECDLPEERLSIDIGADMGPSGLWFRRACGAAQAAISRPGQEQVSIHTRAYPGYRTLPAHCSPP